MILIQRVYMLEKQLLKNKIYYKHIKNKIVTQILKGYIRNI